MQKLILTCASGYHLPDKRNDLQGLLRMVRSASRNVPDARIVVYSEFPLPLPHYVEQRKYHARADMHAVCARWVDYGEYLQFADPTTMVALVDARDVVWQSDIFRRTRYGEVTVHAEHPQYQPDTEPANQGWIERHLGFAARLPDKRGIACAGVITGEAGPLLAYLRDMAGSISQATDHGFGTDQAAHNLVARMHAKTVRWRVNGEHVLHCVLTPHADIATANGNASLSGSKAMPSVVHQYDRVPSLLDMYEALYGHP